MKDWETIKAQFPELGDEEAIRQARAALEAENAAYLRSLRDVRRARDLTQEQLAEAMGVEQPQISKIERQFDRQADLFVSTLRRYIEAMGGRLRIIAEFDDVEVPIDNFQEIDTTNPEQSSERAHQQPSTGAA